MKTFHFIIYEMKGFLLFPMEIVFLCHRPCMSDDRTFNTNALVDVYNSIDHTHTSVGETSVSATISFDVALTDIPTSLNTGLTDDTAKQHVSYSRIVDVKRN